MSIVTKKGDKGRTSLLYGGMVSKDDPRVELNGALDELSSFLGMAKSLIKDKATKKDLEGIQKDLIVINAEIATLPKFLAKLKKRIDRRDVGGLEKDIKKLETKSPVRNLHTPRPVAVLAKNARISSGHLSFRPRGTSGELHFQLSIKTTFIVRVTRRTDLTHFDQKCIFVAIIGDGFNKLEVPR